MTSDFTTQSLDGVHLVAKVATRRTGAARVPCSRSETRAATSAKYEALYTVYRDIYPSVRSLFPRLRSANAL